MNNAALAAKPAKKKKATQFTQNFTGYLLVAPMIFALCAFVFYPMIRVVIYSFQKTNGISATWRGFKNYAWVIKDNMFWNALWNTFYMAVIAVILDVIVCFICASMINSISNKAVKNLFKGVYYLPNVVSSVAVAMLFNFIFYPSENGILNYALGMVGIPPIGWLTNPKISRLSIVIMGLWRSVGYDTILFLAGLQSIPGEIYEAGAIDGATGLQKWWYITIPNMKGTFAFMIMMLTISTMRRFDDVWMIGGSAGNPAGTLDTAVMYIFRNSWLSREVGVASAAAVILFIITMILTAINNKVTSGD
ncbi:MAG: sugar ABC transporter permease [Oscillospiraceae bacterium]|nr:sugar ABC transporter permease [Oscillospiraceae bacterium]